MVRPYALLRSSDHGDLSGHEAKPRQCCTGVWRRALAVAAGLLLLSCGFVISTAGLLGRGLHERNTSHVQDTVSTFNLEAVRGFGFELYEALGGFNPFRFHCPLPGLNMVGGLLSSGSTKLEACCELYGRLNWPYQFPECRHTRHDCSTCWQSSGTAALVRHEAAGLAAVAWAANAAVYSEPRMPMSARLKGFLQSKLLGQDVTHVQMSGHVMRGQVREGLDAREPDLCPRVHDWTEYMLNDLDENIHARIYRSEGAKLAVVVFRGTEQTSISNWETDVDIRTAKLRLGEGGNLTLVHQGFLRAAKRVLPRVRKWVDGYFFHLWGAVPKDWKLVFTGHSLGGALAMLATTLAELDDWSRKPDATIVFGSPRVADGGLDHWWRERGLCKKLLRINVYNDAVHWMPFLTTWRWADMLRDFLGCMQDLEACLQRGPLAPAVKLSERWTHVCGESELLVPGAARGVNVHLDDPSPVGGVLSHLISQCLYGYAYGVAHGGILQRDEYCGVSPSICPSWAGGALGAAA